jgi:RNA polymerase sigma factor (sigma-70 family)
MKSLTHPRFCPPTQSEAVMTDAELLERFVSGRDEAAFEMLVRRHGRMVLGLCRRALRDDHAAEDAFQATFLVLVRNAGSIRNRESLASWLYGVAQRVSRKAHAGMKPRALVHQGESMSATEPDADHDRSEFRPILHDEVGRLPEKYRAPIVLCYFEGRSHEEAARELDWPIGTVKGRLSRARNLLQSRLVRRGVALGLGLVAFLETEVEAAVPESLVESTVRAAARAGAAATASTASDPAADLPATPAGPGPRPDISGPTPRLRSRPRLRLVVLLLILFGSLGGLIGSGNFARSLEAASQLPSMVLTNLRSGGGGIEGGHCGSSR